MVCTYYYKYIVINVGVVDLLEGQRYIISSAEMDRDVGGGSGRGLSVPVGRNNNNWCGTTVGGRRRASVRNKEPRSTVVATATAAALPLPHPSPQRAMSVGRSAGRQCCRVCKPPPPIYNKRKKKKARDRSWRKTGRTRPRRIGAPLKGCRPVVHEFLFFYNTRPS